MRRFLTNATLGFGGFDAGGWSIAGPVQASSHREAPTSSADPAARMRDWYVIR